MSLQTRETPAIEPSETIVTIEPIEPIEPIETIEPLAPRREPSEPVAPSVQPSAPPPRERPGLLVDMWRGGWDVLKRQCRPVYGDVVKDFSCCHCGGVQARALFATQIPESKGYEAVRCDACELVAIHPMPAPDEVPAFYEAAYYGDCNSKFGPVTEFFVGLFRRARVRMVRRSGIRSGRVLDIGCARGLFLEQLQRRGYDPFGTELSADSSRGARALMGAARVRVGMLRDCGFDTGMFDAITAWQVFEHLTDPGATLDECHRLLRPGGALILAVPNIDSWQARWGGAEWFHLDVPRHLFHFSPTSLARLLQAHGFRVERVMHHSLEQNPFGLLQSGLHRVGVRFNGLYDLLKGPKGGMVIPKGKRMFYYGLYLAAFPIAAVVSAMWSILGSGATFTIQARRDHESGAPQGNLS